MVIYLAALSIRVFWLIPKDGFMLDEPASFMFANWLVPSTIIYNSPDFHSAKQVRDTILCGGQNRPCFAQAILNLWQNTWDPPHSNLYYILLRTFLIGQRNGDTQTIIWRGGLLNLLLFTGSFFFFFRLMKLLFKNSAWLPHIATFVTFMSPLTISNTLLFRDYQLAETLYIVFATSFYEFTANLQSIWPNEKTPFVNPLPILKLIIITALTLITGFYSVIFIGLYWVFSVGHCILTKKYKPIYVYTSVVLFGGLLANGLYLKYVPSLLHSERGLSHIEVSLMSILQTTLPMLVRYFSVPVLITLGCLIAFIYINKKHNLIIVTWPQLLVSITALAYFFIIQSIAPFKIIRYVLPVVPFFIIIPICFLQAIKENQKLFSTFTFLFWLSFALGVGNTKNLEYGYHYYNRHKKFADIDQTIPLLAVSNTPFNYFDLIPYLNDNQKCRFSSSDNLNTLLQEIPYQEFYVFFDNRTIPNPQQNIDNKLVANGGGGGGRQTPLKYFKRKKKK
jgi:hypothetical protein